MPLYKYRAVTKTGRNIEGTYEAEDKSEMLNIIRQANNIPIEIEEVVKSKDVMELDIFNKVRIKDISIFCRQFYTMLNAGLTIVSCLEILKEQTESKALRKVTEELYEDVLIGITLTEAIKKHEKVFSELLTSMVEAGEVSGNLDEIMYRMAIHYEKENKINRKIKIAMIYPIILLVLSVIVIAIMLIFVVPTFMEMFKESGTELPVPTKILMLVSSFIGQNWYTIFFTIGIMMYLFTRYYKSSRGRYNVDNIKLKIPILGKSMQKIVTSRFSRTLATMIASGVPLLEAISILGRVVSNRAIQLQLEEVRDELRRGSNLSGSIKRIKEFPPMLTHMLEIGEESGTIDDILDKTANFYDMEVEAAVQTMTSLIEPVMIILMAVIIGGMVVSMILPMFEMVNTIN
ncbi:type II secretion pathway protein F [Gottschalkia acidurici 9a]|uniref:Type II secretion pathway protein F n=1 Tax=Gottschalkia acidurici (strain ATCC 7906 / DSM 604 / BCRC 14475 / CIP 104303 / KCTC 5404 / NCIMB 10678 / 9a) TaxID=1128398 RepID=K0AVC0_GOTA9|nr:type II secretion system F family protein [Gottschalkia acidurici]AFS77798.1 type II secretion pathway protein F [Gottschalkia acidurici 9a]